MLKFIVLVLAIASTARALEYTYSLLVDDEWRFDLPAGASYFNETGGDLLYAGSWAASSFSASSVLQFGHYSFDTLTIHQSAFIAVRLRKPTPDGGVWSLKIDRVTVETRADIVSVNGTLIVPLKVAFPFTPANVDIAGYTVTSNEFLVAIDEASGKVVAVRDVNKPVRRLEPTGVQVLLETGDSHSSSISLLTSYLSSTMASHVIDTRECSLKPDIWRALGLASAKIIVCKHPANASYDVSVLNLMTFSLEATISFTASTTEIDVDRLHIYRETGSHGTLMMTVRSSGKFSVSTSKGGTKTVEGEAGIRRFFSLIVIGPQQTIDIAQYCGIDEPLINFFAFERTAVIIGKVKQSIQLGDTVVTTGSKSGYFVWNLDVLGVRTLFASYLGESFIRWRSFEVLDGDVVAVASTCAPSTEIVQKTFRFGSRIIVCPELEPVDFISYASFVVVLRASDGQVLRYPHPFSSPAVPDIQSSLTRSRTSVENERQIPLEMKPRYFWIQTLFSGELPECKGLVKRSKEDAVGLSFTLFDNTGACLYSKVLNDTLWKYHTVVVNMHGMATFWIAPIAGTVQYKSNYSVAFDENMTLSFDLSKCEDAWCGYGIDQIPALATVTFKSDGTPFSTSIIESHGSIVASPSVLLSLAENSGVYGTGAFTVPVRLSRRGGATQGILEMQIRHGHPSRLLSNLSQSSSLGENMRFEVAATGPEGTVAWSHLLYHHDSTLTAVRNFRADAFYLPGEPVSMLPGDAFVMHGSACGPADIGDFQLDDGMSISPPVMHPHVVCNVSGATYHRSSVVWALSPSGHVQLGHRIKARPNFKAPFFGRSTLIGAPIFMATEAYSDGSMQMYQSFYRIRSSSPLIGILTGALAGFIVLAAIAVAATLFVVRRQRKRKRMSEASKKFVKVPSERVASSPTAHADRLRKIRSESERGSERPPRPISMPSERVGKTPRAHGLATPRRALHSESERLADRPPKHGMQTTASERESTPTPGTHLLGKVRSESEISERGGD